MTSLYHNPFDYHDPTIINVHTLLKPQQYQQPSYIHTQSSPFVSYPPFYQQPYGISNPPNTFTSSLTPTSITPISTPPSPWATYNPSNHHILHQEPTSPPSLCGFQHLIHQPQLHTPTALNQHHHHYLYHEPYFPPKSSPIINDFTPLHLDPTQQYAKETIKSHELIIDAQRSFSVTDSAAAQRSSDTVGASSQFPVSILYDGEEDSYWWVLCIEKFFKEQGTTNALKLPTAVLALKGRAHQWWLWRSCRQPPITTWEAFTTVFLWRFKPEWREILPVDNEEEEPDLDLSLCNGSSSNVTESTTTMEEEVVVDASFTLNLVPLLVKSSPQGDGKTVETHKSITDGEKHSTIVHEHEFDPVAISVTTADFVEKQKHVTQPLKITTTTTPSTEKKIVLTVVVSEMPQQHLFFILQLPGFPIDLFDPGGTTTAFVVKPQDKFLEFLNPCFVVFDPGDEHQFRSPTSIFGNFYSTSPLLVPCDREKIESYNFLFPVKGVSLGATSGRPWVPWSFMSLHGVFDANHPLVSLASKLRDNKVLLSLLWLPWDRGRKDWAWR